MTSHFVPGIILTIFHTVSEISMGGLSSDHSMTSINGKNAYPPARPRFETQVLFNNPNCWSLDRLQLTTSPAAA